MLQRSLIAIVLCLGFSALPVLAFAPATSFATKTTFSGTTIFSSEDDQSSGTTEAQQVAQVPQPPPAVRQKRMDPLLASLTRDGSTANTQMTTIPLFGEVPADSVKVLVPIAGIAFLGFAYGLVVTLSSGDELGRVLLQTTNDIADKVAAQPNQVYDPDVCRGICTQDQSGLKTFMESLRK